MPWLVQPCEIQVVGGDCCGHQWAGPPPSIKKKDWRKNSAVILRDNVNVQLSFYTISQMWGEWRIFHSRLFAPIPNAGISAELQMGTQDSHCLKLWPSTHLSSMIVPSYLAPCDLDTKHDSIHALLILPMSHVPYILFPLPGEMFFPFRLANSYSSRWMFPSGNRFWPSLWVRGLPSGLCSTSYRSFMWTFDFFLTARWSLSTLNAAAGFVSDLPLYSQNLALLKYMLSTDVIS